MITGMSNTGNPHQPPWSADDPPLQPVILWLPDTSAPGFAAAARRQCAQLAQGADEHHFLDLFEDDIRWADK